MTTENPILEELALVERRIKAQSSFIAIACAAVVAILFEINTISPYQFSGVTPGYSGGLTKMIKLPSIMGSESLVAIAIFLVVQLTISSLLLHFFLRKARRLWCCFAQTIDAGHPTLKLYWTSPWMNMVKILCGGEPDPEKGKWHANISILSLIAWFLGPVFVVALVLVATLQFHSIPLTSFLFLCILSIMFSIFTLLQKVRLHVAWTGLLISGFIIISSVFNYALSSMIEEKGFWDFLKYSMYNVFLWILILILGLFSIFYFVDRIFNKHTDRGIYWAIHTIAIVIICCICSIFQSMLFNKKSLKWDILKADFSHYSVSKLKETYDYENPSAKRIEIIGATLDGSHLYGAKFVGSFVAKGNFINAKLKGADFTAADVIGANFTDADLRSSVFHETKVKDAVFNKADFTNANVSATRFENVGLTGTVFNNVKFSTVEFIETIANDTIFQNIKGHRILFVKVKLIAPSFGGDLTGFDFKNSSILNGAFSDAAVLNSSFEEVVFEGTVFNNCHFKNSSFKKIEMDEILFQNDIIFSEGSKFEEVTMFNIAVDSRLKFMNCSLTRATFEGVSFNQGIELLDGKVDRVHFESCVLNGSRINITTSLKFGISFSTAHNADFSGSNLKNWDLSHSDLRGANFTDVSSYGPGTNMEGALIKGIDADEKFKEWARANGALEDEMEWQEKVREAESRGLRASKLP